MILIRVTAECSTSIARFSLALVDEQQRTLHSIANGCTLRDLAKIGIQRADVERVPLCESVDISVPMPSDERARVLITNAQHRAYRSDNAKDYAEKNGWHLCPTGGGCDAFRRRADNGTYVLITVDGEPQAPISSAEPVVAGLYHDTECNGLPLAWIHADNLIELLARISRGEWTRTGE